MKKLLSFLLAISTLSPIFSSCAQSNVDDVVSTTAAVVADSTTTVAETEDPATRLDLPELDYNGAAIRIISSDRSWFADEITVAEKNADIINDAIFDRNIKVEDRLNVKIENLKTGGTAAFEISNVIVRNSILAGADEYDIMVNRVYSSLLYTGDNLYHNLKELEYIDFEKPWWAQLFNEAVSYGNKQWFVTGDLALSLKRFTFVTFFNKNTFAAHQIDNIYDVVRNGKWTVDYQHKIAQDMYSDVNGDNTIDLGDNLGFMTSDEINVDPYWSAFKLPIIGKTPENTYVYALDLERTQDAVTKINNLYYNNTGSLVIKNHGSDEEQQDLAKKFSEGTTAMTTLRLIEAEGAYLRDMQDEYGIIPMPKLNEEQDDYYSLSHDQFSVFAVPSSVPDDRLQMLGAFLEAFCYQSHVDVTPAYYDVTLKTKLTRDEDSAEMLDLIMANLKLDAGMMYNEILSSGFHVLRTVVQSKISNVTTLFTSTQKVSSKMLTRLEESLNKLD